MSESEEEVNLSDEQIQRLIEYKDAIWYGPESSPRKRARAISRGNRSHSAEKNWSSSTENRALRRIVYTTQSPDYR